MYFCLVAFGCYFLCIYFYFYFLFLSLNKKGEVLYTVSMYLWCSPCGFDALLFILFLIVTDVFHLLFLSAGSGL